jgi:chromosome segregation ATPase
MADDLEHRVSKLERTFEEHLLVIHSFIDELRADHVRFDKRFEHQDAELRELKEQTQRLQEQGKRLIDIQADMVPMIKQDEVQIQELRDQGKRLIGIQADMAQIMKGMNGMLKDHDKRLNGAGL